MSTATVYLKESPQRGPVPRAARASGWVGRNPRVYEDPADVRGVEGLLRIEQADGGVDSIPLSNVLLVEVSP